MSTAIIAGCNAPPVFQAAEHDFDGIAFAIPPFIVWDSLLAVSSWGNARGDAAFKKGLAEPAAVVAPVGCEGFRRRQRGHHDARALVIAHLPFGQKQDQRFAVLIGDGVQL